MSYTPTRRQWIKLWVQEHLSGTTRFELTTEQRSIWIDLLVLAGNSNFPGVIASGKYGKGYRGYPLSWIAGGLCVSEEILLQSLEACERKGKEGAKIKVRIQEFDGQPTYVIYIINWKKYQSEYQRQQKYRSIIPSLSPKDSGKEKPEIVVDLSKKLGELSDKLRKK